MQRLNDAKRAETFYKQALEQVADFPPSLDALCRILEAGKRWKNLVDVLDAAATAADGPNETVSYSYRAARILADQTSEVDRAVTCLERCLEISPGFLPAIALYRELVEVKGDWGEVLRLHRLEAGTVEELDRRHWRLLAAASAAEKVDGVDPGGIAEEVLGEDPGHIAALVALERDALSRKDSSKLIDVYKRMLDATSDADLQTGLAIRLADLSSGVNDAGGVKKVVGRLLADDSSDRPLLALSRLCEGMNLWEQAYEAIDIVSKASKKPSVEMLSELARLKETYNDDAALAIDAWNQVLGVDATNATAANGLERSLSRGGQREGLAQAHSILAQNLPDEVMRPVHALLAGHLFEAEENGGQAKQSYRIAFDAQPGPGKAFDALRRIYAGEKDTKALRGLFQKAGISGVAGTLELAVALEEADSPAEAVDVLNGLIEGQVAAGADDAVLLPFLVRLEQNQMAAEQWEQMFSTLHRRAGVTRHPDETRAIEGKRRWLLAEKMASTDAAWDAYQQLHAEYPEDLEVLEALARIAGTRGETTLAIQYLEGLAAGAGAAEDAARFHRRIAEVHLQKGETAKAQDAYLKALDLHAEDMESLEGLKALATDAKDWHSLVGVLGREAAVLTGNDAVIQYKEVARIWEERIDDAAVASDSWKKVLEMAPGDKQAVHHLVTLTRSQEDWQAFVMYAESELDNLTAEERPSLQAEIGETYLKRLFQEDNAIRFLDAASAADEPHLGAAQALERIHGARGAWDMVVDALLRQAKASPKNEVVGLYNKAAQIRLEYLHDREGASEAYAMTLESDPQNGEALRFRGDHLFQSGDLEGAVAIFERMEAVEADRDLDDFDVKIEVALYMYRFAEALRGLGRTADALNRYEKALSYNASHLPSLESVGPMYLAEERWEDGAKVFRQILQLTGGQGDPERVATTYTHLGTVELHNGKLDKAKKRFNKALELRPNDISALQGIAKVLYKKEDWNNLLNVYNNIIYHAQDSAEVIDAYLTKGYVLDAKMQLPVKAAQHYEKSLAFDAKQAHTLLRLGELALRKQDWPEAVSLADQGLGLEDTNSTHVALLHLVKALALGSCGDQDAADKGVKKAVEVDPSLKDWVNEHKDDFAQFRNALTTRLQADL